MSGESAHGDEAEATLARLRSVGWQIGRAHV